MLPAMSSAALQTRPRLFPVPAPAPAPVVEVVVPVFNEQGALPGSIRQLHDHLSAELPFTWRIVIADNASTDHTAHVAAALADDLAGVAVLALAEKGRGRALRAAWSRSDAEVLCYMDVDLSTDLRAMLPLVAPLVSGHSDVAIGTRLARSSRVVRTYWVLTGGGRGMPFDGRVGASDIMAVVEEVGAPIGEVSGLYDLQGLAQELRERNS
jgi:cellulose synthase/poly-beta-1,6-N-acetylglucosamine synthase-like glycosyltransferase